MNSTQFNLESEMKELRMDVMQAVKQRPGNSALQTLLASNMDGYITPGDIVTNGAAAVLLTGCGVAMGTGSGILLHVVGQSVPGPDIGFGLGLLMSGIVVSVRVIADLWPNGESKPTEPILTTEPQAPVIEMGLQIVDGRQSVLLLPDVPKSLVLKMAKATARAYYIPGGQKNFSQRQLGQPWGDHLATVKDKLTGLGYLEAEKNNTLAVTESGAAWLMKIMAEAG